MYIYQDGKLYAQTGEKLVGVEIYSNKVLPVDGTETKLGKEFLALTLQDVHRKFNIAKKPYIFPKPVEKAKAKEVVKEVREVGTTKPTKATTRKPASK